MSDRPIVRIDRKRPERLTNRSTTHAGHGIHYNNYSMNLNITDPAILFPGISLLLLAYTNRYLALANTIRELNKFIASSDSFDENREDQIKNLLSRIVLIRWMQLYGIASFIFCIISIGALLIGLQFVGTFTFGFSLVLMLISLVVAFLEVARSGDGLRIEIERTHPRK